MQDDSKLLQRYVQQGSQSAFSQIVARRLNFVYSVCLRETEDTVLAEDAAQVVFLLLARKAASLHVETSLSGWLFQTARFTARNIRRREARRLLWEKEARENMAVPSTEEDSLWQQVRTALNEALASLSAKDREAILLRFADDMNFSELGAALGTSEDAARMRLNRAVQRLRGFFAKQGVTLSGVALVGVLTQRTAEAAPAAAAARLAGIRFAGSGAAVNPQVIFHLLRSNKSNGIRKAETRRD